MMMMMLTTVMMMIRLIMMMMVDVDNLLTSGPAVMGVLSKRAKQLLTPKRDDSFYKASTFRPVLLVLDNEKPLHEIPEAEVQLG